ncbi:Rcr2p [Nakaseomyces bracarensis]|uniref:Rcr2p n=1 Tax=Nakaseomyces bracarensis TaxID=273131 RepID=UPI003871878E
MIIIEKRYGPTYYTSSDSDDDSFGSSAWEWGRWILLAILVGAMSIFTLMTFTANRRRAHRGQAPIYGTAWMTPPSYRQSQAAYNQNHVVDQENVPMYTERANEHDLGYYDNQGVFHKNEDAKFPAPNVPPPAFGSTSGTTGAPVVVDEDLQAPESAYLRTNDDIDLEFRRPSQPNIRRTITGPSSSATEEGGDEERSSVSLQMQEVSNEPKR